MDTSGLNDRDGNLWSTQNVIDAVNMISTQQGTAEQLQQANIVASSVLSNHNFQFMFDIGSQLIMNSKQYDANVLNFGLKLIEMGIHMHWNKIDARTRDQLKVFLESILQPQDATRPILLIDSTTPRHILNSLSKCFCEVIKCDWPQRWAKLFDVLMATKRNLVVIFILLRLSEDIHTFCDPPNNARRREIVTALNSRIADIYPYLIDCISSRNLDFMKAAFECLQALACWAQFKPELAAYLCHLLNVSDFQGANIPQVTESEIKSSVCEVLIVCLDRKHSKPDSIDIRTCLYENETNLRNLTSCLDNIHRSQITQHRIELEKKICQIFMHLTRYIFIGPPEKPLNLQEIYAIMKEVLAHPSITVSIQAAQFWIKIFTHATKKPLPSISDELTASLLVTSAIKLIRTNYDSQLYGFELDCQEYDAFQARYRIDICELCRNLTLQNEKICFELVYSSIVKSLQQQNNNLSEWEALSSLCSTICLKLKFPENYSGKGVELVKYLILAIDQELAQAANIQPHINGPEASLMPDLISIQLSCVGALNVFLPQWHSTDKELTRQILRKIILLAFYRPDKSVISSKQLVGNNTTLLSNDSFLKGFRSLSRHASAAFVRICLNHSKQLLDIFPDLKNSVDSLFATATDNPFSSEKCLLYEGLTLICNEEPNEATRKKFVLELFESVKWFNNYELTCDQFINFVGLDRIENEQDYTALAQQALVPTQSIQSGQLNRVKLNYVITFLGALTKRVTSRQTLLPELLSFAKPILNIMHSMHNIWLPEMRTKCFKEYHKILFSNISFSYRQQILDSILVSQKSTGKTDIDQSHDSSGSPEVADENSSRKSGETQYIELFSWNFYDSLITCVGGIISKASPEIFGYITDYHLRCALSGAEYLPPLKLHKLIKNFVMPLVSVCGKNPQLIEQILLPILGDFLPFIFNVLENQWKLYKEEDLDSSAKDQELMDEMVRNHLLCNLSKDFVDLLNIILIEKVNEPVHSNNDSSFKLNTNNSNQNGPNQNSDQTANHRISNLGLKLLNARPDFVIIVSTSTLVWNDSTLNSKSILINSVLIRHLLSMDLIKTTDEASLLFRNIIASLGMFGEHEQNCSGLVSLFLQLYEGMRPKIGGFSEHLSRITCINSSVFNEFDSKFSASNEKVKRTQLRKVLDDLVGKNLGQRYKVNTNSR